MAVNMSDTSVGDDGDIISVNGHLKEDGSSVIRGSFNMGTLRIRNAAEPINIQDIYILIL
jgi:hypothetical protein